MQSHSGLRASLTIDLLSANPLAFGGGFIPPQRKPECEVADFSRNGVQQSGVYFKTVSSVINERLGFRRRNEASSCSSLDDHELIEPTFQGSVEERNTFRWYQAAAFFTRTSAR